VVALDRIPGDCTITAVVGDQLDIALEFTNQETPATPIDLTGYTLEAKVFVPTFQNPAGGFGNGDYVVGSVAATFTVSTIDLAEGQISIGLTETQTSGLNPGQTYRWYFRWVDTAGATLTVLSGVFDLRIP
jgi:hypothetical protein